MKNNSLKTKDELADVVLNLTKYISDRFYLQKKQSESLCSSLFPIKFTRNSRKRI